MDWVGVVLSHPCDQMHVARVGRPACSLVAGELLGGVEGRGGEVCSVKEVALGAVGPAIADVDGLGDARAGGEDGVAIDFGDCGVKFVVCAGDFETGQVTTFGD